MSVSPTFALMKKSTIWLIAAIMGVSLLALLVLQTRYFEEVIEMRSKQFDEAVHRSLVRAATDLEIEELSVSLEDGIRKHLGLQPTEQEAMAADDNEVLPHYLSPEKKTFADSVGHHTMEADTTTASEAFIRTAVKEQYLHRERLLTEMIYDYFYEPTDKPLEERVDFKKFDRFLKKELQNHGINLSYHFIITTIDGREIYRCPDYVMHGNPIVYKQRLFPKEAAARMGVAYVHFPEMHKYIFTGVNFILPAILFTLLVIVIFVFTTYLIFRQKRVSEIKNDFINNMTHELKTPISTISLAAQMLGDPNMKKSDAMFQRISTAINDETKRLRFQVEKVLQMSMFEQKVERFKEKEFDANEVLGDVVNIFRLNVENAGGTIETDLQAEAAHIYADEMHMTNVFFNLLDNAMKYKKPEEPLHLKVSTRNNGEKLLISISDNGIGIKKDDLKKVFDKFYRVHTGNRHDVKGFGLGLAYVKSVVNFHRGSIVADSDFGKGTTFTITLPTIKF